MTDETPAGAVPSPAPAGPDEEVLPASWAALIDLAVAVFQAAEEVRDLEAQATALRTENGVLRGKIGRQQDRISRLMDLAECACGEDEEGNFGECARCAEFRS